MVRRISVALASVGAVLVLVVLAAAAGFIPIPGRSDTARPPCGSLPSKQEVASALDTHADTTSALRKEVPGARVTSSMPCEGDEADRALVRISVSSSDQRDEVSDWLGDHDGYGVPVEVVVD